MPTYQLKTLANELFDVEMELDETVGALKQKVFGLKGFEPSLTKLICSGKVLADDSATIGAVGMKSKAESGFVVCMVSKAKLPVPVAAPAPTVPAVVPAPVPAPAAVVAAAAPSAPAGPRANPFAGPEFDAAVSQLMEMGLCRAS